MNSLRKVFEWVLVLVIAGSVLAFGGVQPLAYSLMEVVLFLSTFVLLASQMWKGKLSIALPIWPLLFLLLVGLQLVPLPTHWVTMLSPARVFGVNPASSAAPSHATISIYGYDTLIEVFKFIAYLCGFILAAYVTDFRERKSILVRGLIVLACFESAYGIYQFLSGNNKIFIYTSPHGEVFTTGTYINRNHFAGLLELLFPLILGLGFYAFQRWVGARHCGLDPRSREEAASAGSRTLIYTFLTVFVLIAIVLSRSRGGILGGLFALVFVGALALIRVRRKSLAVGLALVILAVTGYGLWIGLGPVLSRFEKLRQPGFDEAKGRIAIWTDSLQIIRHYPILGTGLGTYGRAYRPYQTGLLENYVDHAHNDYIEFAAETGLVGFALLFLPILGLTLKMTSSFLDDPRRFRRAVTLGCVGSAVALLVHSTTDFNLQIPANALIFAVILGVGYKAVIDHAREEAQSRGGTAAGARLGQP